MTNNPTKVHTIQFSGSGVFNPDVLAATHRQLDAVEADAEEESAHQESDPTVQMTDLLLAGIRARRNRERSVASAEADQPSLQDLAFLV